ncbi:MAG: uridine kinase [Actinomycetota bacterium]|nr:uridine kinase [Actinomycetota bacterium]
MTTPATLDGLAAHVLAEPARLGQVRLVCIDGPAGSGKTTFAGRLADALGDGTGLVSLEDLYEGWTLDGAVARLSAGVLRPLAEGRAGSYPRFDWAAGRFAADRVRVPVPRVLVVEGCGSCARSLDRWTTLRVWVEAPAPLRLSRGLARDGGHLTEHWRRWQESEAAHFAAEDTRARADVRVDGASSPPDGGFVLLD